VPDYDVKSAPPLEVLVVGSSYEMSTVLDDADVVAFVAAQGGRARWLGSNCSGAHLLGRAGLLSGRRVTTYPGGEIMLQARYPSADVVSDERVVVDDDLVTSNGGLVSYEAALALLGRMAGAEVADAVAGDLYFDRLVLREVR